MSIFEPIIIRLRQRKQCFSCGAPAIRKCRTHSTRICESSHCKMTHRRLKSAVSGDLTRPFCEYFPLVTWRTHLFRCAVSLAAGFVLLWIIL